MFKYLSMNFIDFERALGRGSCENSKDIEMCAQEWCWRRRIQDPLQPLLRHYNVLLQPNASSHHDNEHLHFSCHPKKCHKQRNKFETKQSHCGDPKSFDLTWTSMWLHRAQAPAGGATTLTANGAMGAMRHGARRWISQQKKHKICMTIKYPGYCNMT